MSMTPGTDDRTGMADRDVRDLIRSALDVTLAIEAAAGTGKTTVLVDRMVAVLSSGLTTVDRMVAVTFTEKAAGELKLRLREQLERVRVASDDAAVGDRLEGALARLEEAHVNTIHGFCADLLRERPIEAGIDPGFETLDDEAARRLFDAVFHRWIETCLREPPEGVRRFLRRRPRFSDDPGSVDQLRHAAWSLAEWRDFPAPWRVEPFDRDLEADDVVERLCRFADLSATAFSKHDFIYRASEPVRRECEAIRAAERVRPRDHDDVEARLVPLASDRSVAKEVRVTDKAYGPGVSRQALKDAQAGFLDAVRRFAQRAEADLAARLREDLREPLRLYEAGKTSLGRLDFVDLLLKARDLVRDRPDVRRAFQERFTHVFVDEFQDTDPLQAEILLLLTADDPAESAWRRARPAAGKLFVVGDPKQAIYRFRRADVSTYRDVWAQIEAAGAVCRRLTTSFRSVPAIQAVVNGAFGPIMQSDESSLQAGYVPLSPSRLDADGQPGIVVLPVPAPYGVSGRLTYEAIEASLPGAVGGFIEWLLGESGWTVEDPAAPGTRIPVAARHVCLLFRRMVSYGRDVTRPYTRALEARDVPHVLVGGRSFHAREEVSAMRTALVAIEWPDDELSVFGALRGPFFALDDEMLFTYRTACGTLHPFVQPEAIPYPLTPVADALRLLRELHLRRNRRPVADTISRLMELARAHAAFVLRPSGEQALANVLFVAERARRYEAGGGLSFRGFVERLREEADEAVGAEAPILEEGSDGVRLMTVHKAKGLEFPVVVLVDVTAGLQGRPDRVIEPERRSCAIRLGGCTPWELIEHGPVEAARDQAEGVRVAYVAATRARDLLVVPAVGDDRFPPHRWLSPLYGAVYPGPGDWHRAEAPGCPPFGPDSVAERPDDRPPGRTTVPPGLHRIAAAWSPSDEARTDEPSAGARLIRFPGSGEGGSHEVVWWDPRCLPAEREWRQGLRREDLIHRDTSPQVVAEGLQRYGAWQERRRQAIERGAEPSLVVHTVRDRALERGEAEGHDVEVRVVYAGPDASPRPGGRRFGVLVHAALAAVPLDGGSDRVAEVLAVERRIVGATDEEAAAAAAAVSRALDVPDVRRAAAVSRGGRCHREMPVSFTDSAGAVIEGIVDLAYETEDGWTVVDFKTDADWDANVDVHRRQVQLYARGIALATGRPVRGVLLRV